MMGLSQKPETKSLGSSRSYGRISIDVYIHAKSRCRMPGTGTALSPLPIQFCSIGKRWSLLFNSLAALTISRVRRVGCVREKFPCRTDPPTRGDGLRVLIENCNVTGLAGCIRGIVQYHGHHLRCKRAFPTVVPWVVVTEYLSDVERRSSVLFRQPCRSLRILRVQDPPMTA